MLRNDNNGTYKESIYGKYDEKNIGLTFDVHRIDVFGISEITPFLVNIIVKSITGVSSLKFARDPGEQPTFSCFNEINT